MNLFYLDKRSSSTCDYEIRIIIMDAILSYRTSEDPKKRRDRIGKWLNLPSLISKENDRNSIER